MMSWKCDGASDSVVIIHYFKTLKKKNTLCLHQKCFIAGGQHRKFMTNPMIISMDVDMGKGFSLSLSGRAKSNT